jgi:hypothetical protein
LLRQVPSGMLAQKIGLLSFPVCTCKNLPRIIIIIIIIIFPMAQQISQVGSERVVGVVASDFNAVTSTGSELASGSELLLNSRSCFFLFFFVYCSFLFYFLGVLPVWG